MQISKLTSKTWSTFSGFGGRAGGNTPTHVKPATTRQHPIDVPTHDRAMNTTGKDINASPTRIDTDPTQKRLILRPTRKTKQFVAFGLLLLAGALTVPVSAQVGPPPDEPVNICSRTDRVRDAILAAIPANPACAAVTATQLAAIGTLDVSLSDIRNLKSGDFAGLSVLTSLDLSGNLLTTLPADIFDDLTSLDILDLTDNNLTALPPGVFDDLISLTSLDLNDNDLTALPANVFDNLTNLTSLNLNSNDLTTLPANVFDNLTNLTSLTLTDNELDALNADVFSTLVNLETLTLNDNMLSALPDGLFSGLTRLTTLWLHRRNTFTTALPADIFADLPSTAVIRIDLSPIGDLTGVALTVGGSTTINVANAFISRDSSGNDRTITYTATSVDPAIATVSLTGGVGTITGVAMGTTTVSVLANDGESGTVGMLTRDIAVTVVGTGILAFDAATGNTIATPIVAEASGTDTFYVQLASAPASDITLTLTSSDTSEGTVMPGTLTFTAAAGTTSWDTRQAVTVTAVDDNIDRDDTFTVNFAVTTGDGVGGTYPTSLTIPSVTVTVTDDDVAASICSRTMQVQTAILARIPGSPACADVIESQLAAITGILFVNNMMGLTTLLPGDFADLSGITALFLDGNGLTTLPSGIFSDLGRVTILDLNGNALATLPAGAFAGLTSLSTFDLSGNALTALPAGLFTGLTSLTSLDLSRNALTTLPANAFSGLTTSFITLFLNSNALTTLPANAFSGLTGVTTLDLSNNMLSALPAGLFTGLGTLTSLRLAGGNTFTTPLPANLSLPPNLFDPTSVSSAEIRIDLSPIGDLADIPSLTLGGVATINVANAFISRDSVGDDRALSFTITPTGTSVASATESGGVLTITASDTITGVTTIDIVADDSVSSTVTRNIAVTVVEVGLAFFEEVDSATGSTEVTSITTGEPDVPATFYVELISAPTADVTVTVMSDDTTEGMITTGASLTFTTGNWNIRQAVTVTGQDDNLIDVDTSYNITLASTSSDANYNALTETLSATNTDDDVVVDICSRTTEVQTAILNAISPSPICSTVTESQLAAITGPLDLSFMSIRLFQSGDFDGLSGLTELEIRANDLTLLPANLLDPLTSLTLLDVGGGVLATIEANAFSGLTRLTSLDLSDNSLTALPDDLFLGLGSLATLRLHDNTFTTPLPANIFEPVPATATIQIDLSPIGDLADIPSLTLGGVATINVANAFISRNIGGTDRTLSFTITPTGTSVASATESSGVLTITASDTITGVTSVTITAADGTTTTTGGTTTPNTVTRTIAVTVSDVVNICSRTSQVQTAILAAISPSPTCSTVTATQLAGITSLSLFNMSIMSLLADDFADLSGLTSLDLGNNLLSTLPAGIFNPLTALTSLDLSFNSLTMLPSGIFSTLTNLTELVLWDNSSLGTLESNVFSALTNLTRLDLQNTGLSALPAGLFTTLTMLTELRLHDNAFTTPLPADIFDPVPSAEISIDLSPIGDLADIVLTFGTTTMINVADAFISRDLLGRDIGLSFTTALTGTSVTSATESSGVVTITASDTIAGVTNVDIVADDDSGGANADLTRTIAVTVDTVVDICSRTAAVQTAILETISLTSPPACDAVTAGQLAAVAFLNLGDMSITALQSGDFADLSGLTLLVLSNNSLGTLPSGIFSGLTNLGSLFLSDSDLSALESDVFSGLTSLTGLALSGNSLTSLPDGLFDNLTNLTSLELADNDLTALEVGIFDPLTSLTNLDLFDNDLTALPANLFDRLTSLTALSLEDNTFTTPLPADIFDPLPSDAVISIDLSPIGDLTDVALTLGDTTTINVANAFISRNVGGDDRPLSFTTALTGTSVTSATEDAGVLTVTASDTMAGMTSVEITASDSTGGTTGMSARTITVTVTEPAVNICDRTTMVETAILAAIPETNDCTAVTSTQLAAITGTLNLFNNRIQTLQVGDFAGLSGVTLLNLSSNFIFTANALPAGVFTGLDALTELNLSNHRFLTALQVGVFDGLTSLEILNLSDLAVLTTLPAGIFDNLTNLTELNLRNGGLTTLPAGIFDNLMSLTRLRLEFNALTALPAGVFDGLTSLTRLQLENNNLTALPAGVFDGFTSLTRLDLFNNDLIALPAGLFDNLSSLTQLGLTNNPFTTPLPANIFDSLSSVDIRIDTSPIGDLPGVALTDGGTTTINVTNAFISRHGTSNESLSFSEISNDTNVATVTETSGVVTITSVGMGTTTVSVTADDNRGATRSTSTRDIAVTVVATGILAFDEATGDTLATPIAAEASGTDTFYVQLASAPANDVTLTLTSSDTNEGTVSPLTLTFTAAAGATSWDSRQAVTVTAVDDGIVRDDSFTVNFAVTTGDGGAYPTTLDLSSVTVTITDDDTVGIGAYDMLMGGSEISTITTSETGAGNVATFYVALTSQPTGTVTVTISGLVATEHTLTAPVSDTLTFTPTGATAWNTRQVITLNSVDDNVVDGDQIYDLTLTPAGGDYTGVAAQTVSVTNSDTDTAVLTIADMSVDEDAGTATVTVTLSAMVTVGDVTVNATTADGTATAGEDYTAITSQTLTFTAGSTTQTLDITINDDSIGEGNETFTVMLDTLVQPTGVTTVSITDATAEVTITDNETPPTTINLGISPSTIAETADATTITVTATLGDGSASLPTDTVVTLTISGTATGGGTDYTLTMPISTITIAALATSGTKTFMIDPEDDSTTEGEETVIISGTATINGMTATGTDTLTILEAGILVFDATTGDAAPTLVADENSGTDTFYVRLASAPARDVTLTLTSSNTNEGTVSPLTLTFTAAAGTTSWDTRQAVTVTAVPDDIDRDDSFTVDFEIATAGDGDGANYLTTLIMPSVTVTITDDDTVGFTVDIGDGVTTSEGSATPDTFSVVLNSQPTDTVTVTIDGLVTTEHSLTPSTTLMFTTTNWSTAQTVTLNSVDDNVVDGDQIYDLTLTPAGGDYTGVAAQTVSVTNSDTDTATLSIADATVNEGDGTATVTVTLSAMVTAGTVEVNANTIASGTATVGTDYTNTNQALTFLAGSTSETLDIPIIDDSIVEGNETFDVRLSTLVLPPGVTTVSFDISNATVTIIDNDMPGLAVDTGDGVTTSEGSTTSDTFSVVLNSQPTATVTVTIDGLVTTEHSLTPSTTLMFTTTNWSTAQTVTLNSVDDNVVDGDQIYDLTLTPAGGDYTGVAAQTVSVTNSDTDTAVLTIADMSVDEDAGTATVTVTLSAMVTVGDVTVNATTADGTATAGEDYTAITSQTLTFTAGSTTQTLDITINNDTIAEGNEAFTVMLNTLVQPTGVTTVSITDATAIVTITDDETVPTTINLGVSPSTIAETAGATTITVTATLGDGSVSLPTDTVVTLTISGTATITTDYTLTMPISTITIAASATSGTKTFMIDPTNDTKTEGEETVIIGGTAGSFTVNSDTLTIVEAGILVFDAATGDAAPDVVAVEDGGMDTFYVQLASAPARDVTLSLTSSDTNEGTVMPTTLTFTAAAGTTSWDSRQLVTVTAVSDDIDRDDTFTVNFGITTGDGGNYETATLTLPMVAVTITDDDTAGLTVVDGGGVTTSETGTTGTFTVVLDTQPTDTVTVEITGLDTGEHSLTPSTTLTFTTTNWSAAQTVTLTGENDDDVDGDQTSTLTLTASGGDYTGVATQTVSVTNTDDDTAALTIADMTVDENAGTATVTVTLTPALTATGNVTVNAMTVDGTAEGGTDYTAITSQTLTFAAGSTSQTLDITINDDNIAEGDEAFTVMLNTLVQPTGVTTVSIADSTATVTITDNDVPGLTVVDGGGVTTSETGTTGTFTVVLNTQPTDTVTVEISGLDTGEHSLTPSTTLTFTTTNWSAAQTVTLTGENDDDVDGDQTYDLTLTASGGDYTGVAARTVSITNEDDDTAALSIADMSVNEDAGTATVTVTLTPAVTAGTVTVNATTMDGTATIAGGDYTAITSQTLTFAAGSTSQTLDITINDDNIAEGDEAFTVMLNTLVQPTGVTTVSITGATATVTITDDETVPTAITLSVNPSTVAETASATTITVTATLGDGNVALLTPTVVTVSVGSGTDTATEGTDYATVDDFTLTIPAEMTSGMATFMIDPDTSSDNDDTVTIDGTSGSFTFTSATLTIVEAGILVFEAATGDDALAVEIAENGGTDTFYVRLASQPVGNVTLSVASSTGEGTVSPGTLTFTTANWNTRRAVTVTAVDDNIDRGDTFTFMVNFGITTGDGGNYTSSLTLPSVTVLVTDDDMPSTTIDLSVSPDSIQETAGETTITVTATLGGAAFATTETVVTLTISGTATITTDYTLTMPISTITIAALAISGTKTFMIDPEDDTTTEGDETVVIDGTATGFTITSATLRIVEFSEEDQQAIEQTVAAQASGITQVVTEQIGIRLASRTSAGSTQDRQSLSAIDWQDRLAKFTYEGLKRLDSEADIMSLDWLLRAAGGNGQLLMPLGAESLTLWATGGRISTKGDGVADYEGDVNSFILGIDTALANDWLAGVAVSYNDSEVDYTMDGTPEAETEQTLYGIHPYLSRTVSKGLTLWATGGYGFGDVDFSHTNYGQATSDITQWMAAGGLEQQIITNSPWQGALRIKGLWGNAEVDAAEYSGGNPIAKIDSDFWRAHMESEMGYNFSLPGGTVRPYAIVGGRWDHNDAIVSGDEWHIDVGGGVELSDNAFALNISVRTQVTEGDTEEDSIFATGSVTYDLAQDGRGLQIALSRSLDNTSPAFDSHSFSPLTDTASGLSAAPLTSELAYGWTVRPFGLKGALQTYVQNSFDSNDRHYAVGLELAVNALTLNFETGYHDYTSLNSGETDGTGLESMFKTKIRW